MKINYAILNLRPGAEAVPVLLPASISHDELSLVGRPISAGCCTLSPDVRVFGRSESLNLAAHADDARLIKMWFGRPETGDVDAPLGEIAATRPTR
jgi:hypothetical protein